MYGCAWHIVVVRRDLVFLGYSSRSSPRAGKDEGLTAALESSYCFLSSNIPAQHNDAEQNNHSSRKRLRTDQAAASSIRGPTTARNLMY